MTVALRASVSSSVNRHISFLRLPEQIARNSVTSNANLLSSSFEFRSPKCISPGKNQGVGRAALLPEAPGWKQMPRLFQLLEATCVPWLVVSSIFSQQLGIFQSALCFRCHPGFFSLSPSRFPRTRTLVIISGLPR